MVSSAAPSRCAPAAWLVKALERSCGARRNFRYHYMLVIPEVGQHRLGAHPRRISERAGTFVRRRDAPALPTEQLYRVHCERKQGSMKHGYSEIQLFVVAASLCRGIRYTSWLRAEIEFLDQPVFLRNR